MAYFSLFFTLHLYIVPHKAVEGYGVQVPAVASIFQDAR
jgi:hypothetical protein